MVPGVRPVMVQVPAAPVMGQVWRPSLAVTVREAAPVTVATVMVASLALALVAVGGPGAAGIGVIALEGLEEGEVPPVLVAVAVKV